MLRQSVRHFAKAASKSTSTAKKAVDFNEKSGIEVKNVIRSITCNVGNEEHAIKADDATKKFKEFIRNLKIERDDIEVISVSRAVCKTKWDYRIDIEFKSLEGMQKFNTDSEAKEIVDKFIENLKTHAKAEPATQGFVFNRSPIIVKKAVPASESS